MLLLASQITTWILRNTPGDVLGYQRPRIAILRTYSKFLSLCQVADFCDLNQCCDYSFPKSGTYWFFKLLKEKQSWFSYMVPGLSLFYTLVSVLRVFSHLWKKWKVKFVMFSSFLRCIHVSPLEMESLRPDREQRWILCFLLLSHTEEGISEGENNRSNFTDFNEEAAMCIFVHTRRGGVIRKRGSIISTKSSSSPLRVSLCFKGAPDVSGTERALLLLSIILKLWEPAEWQKITSPPAQAPGFTCNFDFT